MIFPTNHRRFMRGFTLTEVLVIVVIIAVIALFAIHFASRSIERAKFAVDIGKMREIGCAMISRSVENNDRCYSKDEIGNSMYREWKDPLSLCQVLKDYLPGETTWIGPAATKRHKTYKNSYAWSVSPNLTNKNLSQIESPRNTILLWNNFGYTLPSVYNVPEGMTAGPRQAPKQYHYRPWNGRTAANWYYLDGHLETF
jgi:prepilin-type N-terminal cleavage/methylation domain-containing protein